MDRLPRVPHSLAPGAQTACYLAWLKVSVALRHDPHVPVGTRSIAGGSVAHARGSWLSRPDFARPGGSTERRTQ